MLDTVKTSAFTLELNALEKACKLLASVIDKRARIPILSAVSFGPEGMTATDLDQTLTVDLDYSGERPEGLVLDLQSVQKALKGADKGAIVRFYVDHDGAAGEAPTVRLEADDLLSEVQAYPAEDWPQTQPIGDAVAGVLMPAAGLKGMLDFLSPCISQEVTRYYLNGIFLCVAQSGRLTAVATDGHRLGYYPTGHEVSLRDVRRAQQVHDGLILPLAAVKLALAAMAPKPQGRVHVSFHANAILMQSATEGWTLRTKTVDGCFPDYTRVIPKNNRNVLQLDRAKAEKAATRLGGVASHGPLVVDTTGTGLPVIRSDDGKQRMDLPCIAGAGEFKIGVNAKYLIAALKGFSCDTVHLSVADGGEPMLLTQPGGMSEAFYVVMPMRTT